MLAIEDLQEACAEKASSCILWPARGTHQLSIDHSHHTILKRCRSLLFTVLSTYTAKWHSRWACQTTFASAQPRVTACFLPSPTSSRTVCASASPENIHPEQRDGCLTHGLSFGDDSDQKLCYWEVTTPEATSLR